MVLNEEMRTDDTVYTLLVLRRGLAVENKHAPQFLIAGARAGYACFKGEGGRTMAHLDQKQDNMVRRSGITLDWRG